MKKIFIFLLAGMFASASFAQNRQRIEVEKVKMDVQYKKVQDPKQLAHASIIVKTALKEECGNMVCSAVPFSKFQQRVQKEVNALGGLEVDRVDFVKH